MASSLQTLIKILQLEQKKDYQNRAVIGGFARFAYHWSKEAHSQARNEEHHALVEKITEQLRDYEQSAPADRPAIVEEIIAMATGQIALSDEEEEAVELPPTPPVQHPEPTDEVEDVGIGLIDEQEDELEEEEIDEPIFIEEIEERPPATAGQSVRERRGYAWKQVQPAAEGLEGLTAPVLSIDGVGDTRAGQFDQLGLHTVHDVLFNLPRRYDDYSKLKTINHLEPGEVVTVIGMMERIKKHTMKSGGTRVEAYISDGSGYLRLNWFNQPWLEKQLTDGEMVVVSGKIEQYLGRLVMNSPEMEPIDRESLHAGRIVPVYPLTKGLSGKVMRRLAKDVVDQWAPQLPDPLPLDLRERADLMDFGDAIAQAHFPDSLEDKESALLRLAFDQLMILQLAMLQRRYAWQSQPGIPLNVSDEWVDQFLATLPYDLTGAQQRAIEEIRRDLASGTPMNRLLQGDVGSGKTVVAALAAAIACVNGTQAAIMAPTSLLAEQHYASLSALLSPVLEEHSVALLTGNISAGDREAVYDGLADGSIQVVVGTHALIQPGLAFHRLGLAIIDEQHRFGVMQRGALRDKAGESNPHLLVMTATPIPRTLALTVHADLDLTTIDEMPPGRTPVQTRILQAKERERAYSFIRTQIEKGYQAYIICPLVADSDELDARSAVSEYERLQNDVFPDLSVGLAHGRMHPDEKEAAMAAFYRGETQILVSTTVIEVGIDVPNASVILIENANRFGLAQLHQLRGRVGRGDGQGYCLLVSDQNFIDVDERLRAVEETTDGFKLAEIDWQMRGAGDLLGTQQSGIAGLDLTPFMDLRLVEQVQREAWTIYEQDPLLEQPEHGLLTQQVSDYMSSIEIGDVS
ncbi:MAG: ATP-dependent DNA helicase RecG [Anaerolineae bacterium]|nr:ATP-dependent DNA helicase RecG [Anaerolineae bacterium]